MPGLRIASRIWPDESETRGLNCRDECGSVFLYTIHQKEIAPARRTVEKRIRLRDSRIARLRLRAHQAPEIHRKPDSSPRYSATDRRACIRQDCQARRTTETAVIDRQRLHPRHLPR